MLGAFDVWLVYPLAGKIFVQFSGLPVTGLPLFPGLYLRGGPA